MNTLTRPKVAVLLVALLALLLAAPLFLSRSPEASQIRGALAAGQVSQAIAAGGDALRKLMARSPGERGMIMDGKGKGMGKGAASAPLLAKGDEPARPAPQQRALGKIFDAEPLAAAPALAPVPIDFPFAEEGIATAMAAPAQLVGFPGGGFSGGGGGFFPGVVIGEIPPGGSGPPQVITPIPEPGTWLMMIVGFGLLGHQLRRRSGQGSAPQRPSERMTDHLTGRSA